GPLAGRWTRRGFFGGCNGVGTEFSGVSFIGYAPLCLGYSVINVHSSATPFSPYSRESIFCCGAGARAARSRGEGDRGRHSVLGISTARPLWRGTGLGGAARAHRPAQPVRGLVRAGGWRPPDTGGERARGPRCKCPLSWRRTETCSDGRMRPLRYF